MFYKEFAYTFKILVLSCTLCLGLMNSRLLGQKMTKKPVSNIQTIPFGEKEGMHFAQLAMQCVGKPYPYKPDHVITDSSDMHLPKILHPAFFGCFDWHSSVHGHWMLVKLLKVFPNMSEATEIRKALAENLTGQNLLKEAEYFERPSTKTFERTYGWAWLLKLVAELDQWDDPDGRQWREAIRPLENIIVQRYLDFLPIQTYPIRTGDHPNTAFGLAFASDYAKETGNLTLQQLIEQRSKDYFLKDEQCPASWEPGGADFLSPCLQEADLMRRIIPITEYWTWFHHFLPGAEEGKPLNLFKPVIVADRTDPKIVHLDGLNLSRAWCLLGISRTLYGNNGGKTILEQSALAHMEASLSYVTSGEYAGEHWLATFAVYALTVTAQ